MDDAQVKQLKDALRRAATRAEGRPFQFFYCQEGDQGEPVLLVDRRLSPAKIREVRRAARLKKFVRGVVYGGSGGLTFRTPTPEAGKLKKNLRQFFGPRVPPLKRAKVLGPEEAAADRAEPGRALSGGTEQQQAAWKAEQAAAETLAATHTRTDAAARSHRSREDTLEEAIGADPALAAVQAAAQKQEAVADAQTAAVFDLEDQLAEQQDRLAALSTTLEAADKPTAAQVAALGKLSAAVNALSTSLDEAVEQAEAAAFAAQSRRAALEEAVAGAGGAVGRARASLEKAAAALDARVREETAADDALFAAEQDALEADRLAGVAEAMAAARALVAKNGARLKALEKTNPRSTEKAEQEAVRTLGGAGLLDEIEAQYAALREAGAAEAELRAVFDAVPGPWRPAPLTEHMQWFTRIRDWQGAMQDAGKSAETLEEITHLLSGGDSDTTREAKLALQQYYADNPDEAVPEGIDVHQVAELLALVKVAGEKTLSTAAEEDPTLTPEIQGEGYDQHTDPVLKRMRDERMLRLAAELGEEGLSWLTLLATNTPAIALYFSGTYLAKELTAAGMRIAKQVRTGGILAEAETAGSAAVEALRQARSREARLALERGVNAALASVGVAADATVLAGGITLPIAFAVKIGASIVQSYAMQPIQDQDKKLVARARDRYDKAMTGDAEAARELFVYSKRYAKGMLAWMAVEGDEIARRYANMQGISDEELERTCPAVLQRFLLRAAKEEEEAAQTPKYIARVKASFGKLLARIGTYLLEAYESIDRFFNGVTRGSPVPEIQAIPEETIARLIAVLTDFAAKRAFLNRRPLTHSLLIADLDAARAVYDQQLAALRQRISDNLVWIGDKQAEVGGNKKLGKLLGRVAKDNIHLMSRIAVEVA